MAFVQAQKGFTAGDTFVASGAMNTTTGNALVAFFSWRTATSGTVTSITDNAGNVWVQHPDSPVYMNDQSTFVYYCLNAVGREGHVLTITSSGWGGKGLLVFELSGRSKLALLGSAGNSHNTETTGVTAHSGPPTGVIPPGSDVITFGAPNADTTGQGPFTATNGWIIPTNGAVDPAWATVGLYKENVNGASINATYSTTMSCTAINFVIVLPSSKPVLFGQTGEGWTKVETMPQQNGGNAVWYAAGYTALKSGTAVRFYLPIPAMSSASNIKIAIYDSAGRNVAQSYATALAAGQLYGDFRKPFTVKAGSNYRIVLVTDAMYFKGITNSGSSSYASNQATTGNFSYTSINATLPTTFTNMGQEVAIWIEGEETTSTSWRIKKGFNFRSTRTFVIDGPGEVAVLGEDLFNPQSPTMYPTSYTLDGVTFNLGWTAFKDGARDRIANIPSSTDQRLAGHHAPYLGGTFKIQLGNAPGRYRMWAGFCDQQYTSATTMLYTLRDSNKTIFAKALPKTLQEAQTYDVLGNRYSSGAAWAAAPGGGGMYLDFETDDTSNGNGGPFIYIDVGTEGVNGCPIAHLAFQYLGSTTKKLISDDVVTGYPDPGVYNGAPTTVNCLPWTATESGVVTALSIWLVLNGYTNHLKLVIADSAGKVLGVTSTILPNGDGLYTAPLMTQAAIAAGATYYLGFIANNNDGSYGHAGADNVNYVTVYYDSTSGSFANPPSQLTFSTMAAHPFKMSASGYSTSGGALTKTFTVASTGVSDSGSQVTVAASDSVGSTLSNLVTLTVQALQKLKLMLIGVG